MIFKGLGFGLIVLLLSACGQPPRDYLQPEADSKASAASVTKQKAACTGTAYRVVLNDNLGEIALRCKVSVNQLIGVNQLTSPYIIYPGQELIIPRDPLISPETKQASDTIAWRWPIDHQTDYAYVLDSAGIQGLEVYAEVGTLVRAVAKGEVVFAENSKGPLGNMVMIRHTDEHLSIYAHLQRLQVKQSDQVKAGDVIANLGQSGRTVKPKLYFELRHKERKIPVEPILGQP